MRTPTGRGLFAVLARKIFGIDTFPLPATGHKLAQTTSSDTQPRSQSDLDYTPNFLGWREDMGRISSSVTYLQWNTLLW